MRELFQAGVPVGERGLRFACRVAIATLSFFVLGGLVYAQSTFGTILGTVTDPSGAVVAAAKIELTNSATNTVRTAQTDASGSYQFSNIDVGTYTVAVDAAGFQRTQYQAFDLTARETKRVDVSLQLGTAAAAVNVQANVAIVQTDSSNIAESKGTRELTDLPVAIGTRASGSTSAFSTLTAQPGVQTDGANLMVAGALPDQISLTLDGVSNVKLGRTATSELFPSFYSIEEIKISETINPASVGGVADVTVISKSGSNTFHGGAFENFQNTDLNAADTFSHQVTPVKMNDFGIYLGGPVIFPGYNGRNKTFFFGSFEVLRLPKSVQTVWSVPTQAMRNGDLTAYDGTTVPASAISPFSQKLLNFFYPLPNYGPAGAITNNFLALYPTPINSAQGDVRIDEIVTPRHMIYARYSYKNKREIDAPPEPLTGGISRPGIYNSFVGSYTWLISPTIINEARFGANTNNVNITEPVSTSQVASQLGLTYPPLPTPILSGCIFPSLSIAGYGSFYGGYCGDQNPKQTTYQITDALTWTKGKHTLKFGGDIRFLHSLYTNVYGCCRLGNFSFNGSANLGFSPFSGFLQGYPDNTAVVSLTPNGIDTDSYSTHWDWYVQDDWKVSRSLTINFGLRWEYNPGYIDHDDDLSNWDPNYTSVVDGKTIHGAVIVPNQASFAKVNPLTVQTLNGTPFILASSVGVPSTLSNNSRKDFAPRIGFAYRVGGSDKTVLRGGYGRYIQALQSARAGYGWATDTSDLGSFENALGSNGAPLYKWPYSYPSNIAQPGTDEFEQATALNYKDPIVEEWNLTLERDLGKGVGIRVSYDGNHSYNLPVQVDTDQVHPNTLGFENPVTQAAQPFPQLAYILSGTNQAFGNYQAGTVSVHKRSSNFQFEASYTFTRNLSNAVGSVGGSSTFPTEYGNLISDYFHPGIDYGNVPFSRRDRVLITTLYQLPFGKGQTFLNNSPWMDRIVGGWNLGGVLLFQTGPFMSVSTLNDPSGVGFNVFNSTGGRADNVSGVNPYEDRSLNQWINPAAFANPANNIGRFGDSLSGAVVGPGTQAVSASLIKSVALTERMRVQFGAQVANLFNHANYAPPSQLTLGVPGFATITAMQTAEGASPRAIQLTARFSF